VSAEQSQGSGGGSAGVGSLEGKVAVVTGAGRNIGRAIALALVEVGARVAVVDLDAAAAWRVQTELALRGAESLAIACDVSEEAAVESMVAEVVARFGRVDILVNNVAATDRGHTVVDQPVEEWRRIIDVTVTSAFVCSKHAARAMIRDGVRGCIVNLGSTSGYLGRVNATAYPTAKSALIGLTRSMAVQLGQFGIRVNLVAPNKAGSPVGERDVAEDRRVRNLLGRPTSPEDVARAVRFLVSDEAALVTGVDLLVDAGAVLAGDLPDPVNALGAR